MLKRIFKDEKTDKNNFREFLKVQKEILRRFLEGKISDVSDNDVGFNPRNPYYSRLLMMKVESSNFVRRRMICCVMFRNLRISLFESLPYFERTQNHMLLLKVTTVIEFRKLFLEVHR